jgi:hypothetical protein
MILRSITICTKNNPNSITEASNKIREILKKEGVDFRTMRLCLPPLDSKNARSVVNVFSELCLEADIRWLCAPFDITTHSSSNDIEKCALKLLINYPNLFINFILGKKSNISWSGALTSSRMIKHISSISSSGYDNFRFGVSFNCAANGPFFPFTHQDGDDGFSIACEFVADFINKVNEFDNFNRDYVLLKKELIKLTSDRLSLIGRIADKIEKETGLRFFGVDASLAPYPDSEINSVAKLIEVLGVESFGSYGTLHFTEYLTDIIRMSIEVSGVKSVGFNGVMYSILEDLILSEGSRSNNYSIDSLLLFSSVCGCGIDMVPVPGSIFEEEMASMMLDVGAMSNRLNKPLGIRLLPVPMRRANQYTQYNFDFLCNTRIKNVKNLCCCL